MVYSITKKQRDSIVRRGKSESHKNKKYNSSQFESVKCKKCGIFNHLAKFCPVRKAKKVTNDSISESLEKSTFVHSVEIPKNDNLSLNLHYIQTVKIDTGADVSVPLKILKK